ncbi:hypothetical protein F4777DRAFT_477143 [Nemania sp. FL0916]|nr:hypothetical protein F4777DRAFT_477143 [Nemania sp. FL0916]
MPSTSIHRQAENWRDSIIIMGSSCRVERLLFERHAAPGVTIFGVLITKEVVIPTHKDSPVLLICSIKGIRDRSWRAMRLSSGESYYRTASRITERLSIRSPSIVLFSDSFQRIKASPEFMAVQIWVLFAEECLVSFGARLPHIPHYSCSVPQESRALGSSVTIKTFKVLAHGRCEAVELFKFPFVVSICCSTAVQPRSWGTNQLSQLYK